MLRNAGCRSVVVACAWLGVLTGCAPVARTAYVRPDLPVAPAWEGATGVATVTGRGGWLGFDDAYLNALVSRVLAANPDLAAAGVRLIQARSSADLADRQRLPDATARIAEDASSPAVASAGWTHAASGSIGITWEVDLYGRLAAQRDDARWTAEATAQDLAATRLTLIGDTARYWWRLAYANERLVLARQSLAYAERTSSLVGVQYHAGAAARIALLDAEQAVVTQRAAIPLIEQDRSALRNALAALLGEQGFHGPEPTTLPRTALPMPDAGLPADLLARRPDLAAAELRLRSTLARSDAERASLYPALSLTAGIGATSPNLLDILTNPVGNLGVVLSQSTLDPRRIRLRSRIATADYDIAALQFTRTFYDALRDTASALSARGRYMEQERDLSRSFQAAVQAEALYERRYRFGMAPLRDWLDAQERRRSAEAALLDGRSNMLQAHIDLQLALGDVGRGATD